MPRFCSLGSVHACACMHEPAEPAHATTLSSLLHFCPLNLHDTLDEEGLGTMRGSWRWILESSLCMQWMCRVRQKEGDNPSPKNYHIIHLLSPYGRRGKSHKFWVLWNLIFPWRHPPLSLTTTSHKGYARLFWHKNYQFLLQFPHLQSNHRGRVQIKLLPWDLINCCECRSLGLSSSDISRVMQPLFAMLWMQIDRMEAWLKSGLAESV